MTLKAFLLSITMGLVVVLSGMTTAHGADEAKEMEAYQRVLDVADPAFVQIKYVLKMQGGGQFGGGGDVENKVNGVMISKDGLVLCSNIMMTGGYRGTASDLNILIGKDTEGVSATILARDKELDLVWVKIDEPAEDGYDYLDLESLSSPRPPKLGEKLYTVNKLSEFFGEESVVVDQRVVGSTSKPRKLYIVDSPQVLGVPLFTAEGKAAGVMVMQVPDAGAAEGAPNSPMGRGGGPALLPMEQVIEATARAMTLDTEEEDEETESMEDGEEE